MAKPDRFSQGLAWFHQEMRLVFCLVVGLMAGNDSLVDEYVAGLVLLHVSIAN